LEQTDAASVVSISEYTNPPQWAVEETEAGYLREYFEMGALWSKKPTRTQDLPELCYPNGAVFATSIDSWHKHESFYTPQTVGYRMPPERSFDIDEPWELELVRNILE
jgi:N-acylneuraminate cytidylyltransferase